MNMFLQLLAAIFILAGNVPCSLAALPPKNVDFEGTIKAINEKNVTVQGPKGTRVFGIYSGTVFGQRATKKLSDYVVGEKVRIVFSEQPGKTQAQAENIRNPEEDKKKAKPANKKNN